MYCDNRHRPGGGDAAADVVFERRPIFTHRVVAHLAG